MIVVPGSTSSAVRACANSKRSSPRDIKLKSRSADQAAPVRAGPVDKSRRSSLITSAFRRHGRPLARHTDRGTSNDAAHPYPPWGGRSDVLFPCGARSRTAIRSSSHPTGHPQPVPIRYKPTDCTIRPARGTRAARHLVGPPVLVVAPLALLYLRRNASKQSPPVTTTGMVDMPPVGLPRPAGGPPPRP